MFARMPAGCSYTNVLEDLIKFTGIFGLDSIDKNNRKFSCGFNAPNRFSKLCNHCGARWTFFTKTHEPLAAALLMALSALAMLSSEPIATFAQAVCCRLTRASTL